MQKYLDEHYNVDLWRIFAIIHINFGGVFMYDKFSSFIAKTIEALDKYAQELDYWPSRREWNKYANQHKLCSAETLNYLCGWEQLRLECIAEYKILKNSPRSRKVKRML
jgi:hypothetical protein